MNKVLAWLIGFAVVFFLASLLAPSLVNEFLNTLRDLLAWLGSLVSQSEQVGE